MAGLASTHLMTILPAFSAAMDIHPWSPIGELMCTTSIDSSASIASKEVKRAAMPKHSLVPLHPLRLRLLAQENPVNRHR